MKIMLALIYACFLFTNCKIQKVLKSTEFSKSTDLKGKVWHTGENRYGGSNVKNENPSGNGFSNHVSLFFLDKDSIQLKHYTHSPSIGGRIKIINGTYRVGNKNEVSIIFSKSKGFINQQKISINGKNIDYAFYIISQIKNDDFQKLDLTALPSIKTYQFKIIKHLADNRFITAITLIDNDGVKYSFAKCTFDTRNE